MVIEVGSRFGVGVGIGIGIEPHSKRTLGQLELRIDNGRHRPITDLVRAMERSSAGFPTPTSLASVARTFLLTSIGQWRGSEVGVAARLVRKARHPGIV